MSSEGPPFFFELRCSCFEEANEPHQVLCTLSSLPIYLTTEIHRNNFGISCVGVFVSPISEILKSE
jgi:hypothetical protein